MHYRLVFGVFLINGVGVLGRSFVCITWRSIVSFFRSIADQGTRDIWLFILSFTNVKCIWYIFKSMVQKGELV